MLKILIHLIQNSIRLTVRQFSKFLKDHRAVSALEFAIVFPIAFTSMFAVIEVARYHYINSKLHEVVRSVSRDQQAVFNKEERESLNSAKIHADFNTEIEDYFGTEISLDDVNLEIKVYDNVSDYVDGIAIAGENVVGQASQLVVYQVTYNWQSITPYIDALLSDEIKTLKVLKIIQNEP